MRSATLKRTSPEEDSLVEKSVWVVLNVKYFVSVNLVTKTWNMRTMVCVL